MRAACAASAQAVPCMRRACWGRHTRAARAQSCRAARGAPAGACARLHTSCTCVAVSAHCAGRAARSAEQPHQATWLAEATNVQSLGVALGVDNERALQREEHGEAPARARRQRGQRGRHRQQAHAHLARVEAAHARRARRLPPRARGWRGAVRWQLCPSRRGRKLCRARGDKQHCNVQRHSSVFYPAGACACAAGLALEHG